MPTSSDKVTITLCVSVYVPLTISFCLSEPRFHVRRRNILPVCQSITGAGFPQVFVVSSQSTVTLLHVFPPSCEHLRTRSMSPVSEHPRFLPSANASNVPDFVNTMAGMRKQEYPASPLRKI